MRLPPSYAIQSFVAAVAVFLGVSAGARELPDFTDLVTDNAPAVVNISTIGTTQNRQRQGMEDYYRFFDPPDRNERPRSLGSGFIVSADGLILTNNHVIEGAREIIVRLNDRREMSAELIGQDARADLAVLKVEVDEPLPTVQIGRSDQLRVGSWVLAIGSPFGFDYSVTAGIVSAKGRSLRSTQNGSYVPFIQTDVAINPGNSGGPLFNLDGEVIGINAQIYSSSGGFMGVSFAIPIDMAMDVAEQLQATGRVSRGWLGVEIQEVTRGLAESFGLDRPRGALITRVGRDSPAERGGLREGDIITEFNGRAVERSSDLPLLVGRLRGGTRTDLELFRDGEMTEFELAVGELADVAQLNPPIDSGAAIAGRLGIEVVDITETERVRLDLEGGVQVTAISPRAQDSELRVGDIIMRLNHEAITSVERFAAVAEGLRAGRRVPVLVMRDDNPAYLALRVPEE